MPIWLLRRVGRTTWRRIPWKTVWAASLWLAHKGRDRVQANLTQHEQTEFWNLIKKSKGRPANLSKRERTRLKHIAGKAIRG